MPKLLALVLTMLLVATACSSTTDFTAPDNGPDDPSGDSERLPEDDPVVDLRDIDLVAALIPFDACESFLDHVQTEAAERVGPYGLDGFGGYYPVAFDDVALEADVGLEAPEEEAIAESGPAAALDADEGATTLAQGGDATGGGDLVGGVDFSETNVQEVGVAEPDIVKTDGRIIVTASNNRITVVDVANGDAEERGSLYLEGGWVREIFLAGDRILAIGDGDGQFGLRPAGGDAEGGFAEDAIGEEYLGVYVESTVVWQIDVSGQPEVVEQLDMQGRYLSARAVDGTARIVVTSTPAQLPFVYPQSPAGEERAEQTNREIVAESTVDDWVPIYETSTADGRVTGSGQLVECTDIHRPEAFAGFQVLSVVGLDLDGDVTPLDTTAVLASGETVYASTESIFVATTRWPEIVALDAELSPDFEDQYTTSVHKFSLGDDGTADYEASGSVRGHLLNQFSLDEYDGYLRVASTDGSPWGFESTSESYITVLEQRGEELTGVGQVGGLGEGEQIFAVRFLDDTAYVVTFRQVDPFYVVDLTSPSDPSVVGELKIPGFSSYLHPIGDDLVLGVGQEATDDGFTTGAKVSLFDVADPSDPTELAKWTTNDGYSDVEWDHRAFTWWGPDNLAILPLTVWSDNFFGAVILEVDRESGIREVGRVDQLDETDGTGKTECIQVEPAATSFENATSELDYIALEGGSVVVCPPGTTTPVEGYYCDGPYRVAEVDEIFGPSDLTLPGGPDDELHLCWPENLGGDPIVRTLIVEDDLWTMSWRFLQANDLSTLGRTVRLPIT
ncbi:MAG: beta-propeller domain-containing protein [Acidimicrobiia bacterium]|nr:beta-propeller domain-containing protein [Acidimicrobiia bacterium]